MPAAAAAPTAFPPSLPTPAGWNLRHVAVVRRLHRRCLPRDAGHQHVTGGLRDGGFGRRVRRCLYT